jgi:hypothetical protein
MICLQISFFLKFKVEHPSIKVGQRTFENLKPYFVKKLWECNTCCKYHIEVVEFCVSCNNMRVVGKGNHDHIGCQCDCKHIYQHEGEGGEGECQTSSKLYPSITKLWEEVVCPKGLFDE